MKKFGFDLLGVSACLALAAILGWSALPTNAEGDTCPLKAAAAKAAGAEAGTCPSAAKNASLAKGEGTCPSEAKNASLAKGEGTCPSEAKNASLAKGEGTCPSEAKNASLAKDEKGGCCADKAAKPAVNTEGGAEPAAKLAADKDCGECPSAKNASVAAGEKGECCKDGAADIAKLVKSDARFTTLALAVKAAGMEGEFQCPSAKTVLAPTNEAFQKLPAEQWAAILQDDAKLKALVASHIIKGAAMKSGCLAEAKHAKNANDVDLGVSQCPQSGKVTVGNAGIVGDALVASNGNVLVVDSVILPADMQVAKAESEDQVQVAAAE